MGAMKLVLSCGLVLMSLLAAVTSRYLSAVHDRTRIRRMTVDAPDSYTVVIDAGSSGSRARVYAIGVRPAPDELPNIDELSSLKVKPGISEFPEKLDELPAYLAQLIDAAKDTVPSPFYSQTPVYLMATAGMRMLPEESANDIMGAIHDFLSSGDNNPFMYESINARILSGEEEGVFAWIAANYLQGSFSGVSGPATSGIMELGGASTQLAFVPEGAILADKFPVKIAQTLYPVYVHSYLEYGQQEVVLRIMEYLQSQNPQRDFIENPCMLNGDSVTETTNGHAVAFNGTGRPSECLNIINTFTRKSVEFCSPEPCSIGQIYQPSISHDQRFYTLGAFLFCIKRVGALGEDGNFRLLDVQSKAMTYCQKPFHEAKREDGGSGEFLSTECTMALYLHRLFTYGYAIAEDNDHLYSVRSINDEPIEWTLGAAIYENERHLCD